MKPAVMYPDPESVVVPWLNDALEADAGVEVPSTWKPTDGPFLLVGWDATFLQAPIAARYSVRLTAWAETTSAAKALVLLAQGLMLAEESAFSAQPLTGPFPARDPETHAETATVTVQVRLRSIPIP